MITAEQLTREIELTTAAMIGASPDDREYLLGKLAALLWVAGSGDLLRVDAGNQARAAWAAQQAAKAKGGQS